MHMDYGNNSFLHPPKWENPEAVSIIIYLSDISETGGGTSVVPRNTKTNHLYNSPYLNMPGINNYQFNNDRQYAEDYFQQEHPEVFQFRQQLYQHEIIPRPKKETFFSIDWIFGIGGTSGQRRTSSFCNEPGI